MEKAWSRTLLHLTTTLDQTFSLEVLFEAFTQEESKLIACVKPLFDSKGFFWTIVRKTMDWGGGGWEQCWTRTKKMVLAQFHIFLKSPMLEKPISFLREISVLPKVYLTNRPHRLKTQMCFADQSTKVFWIKTLLHFAIRLTIVFTSARTVMQIMVSTTLYKRWPSPTSAAPSATGGVEEQDCQLWHHDVVMP